MTTATMTAARHKVTHIECTRGILTVAEALAILAAGQSINMAFSQVVMGVYPDGRKTSLKGRRDGLYNMGGSLSSEVAQ
jgi:hypothetical protein